jgi:hypothetical protein
LAPEELVGFPSTAPDWIKRKWAENILQAQQRSDENQIDLYLISTDDIPTYNGFI